MEKNLNNIVHTVSLKPQLNSLSLTHIVVDRMELILTG